MTTVGAGCARALPADFFVAAASVSASLPVRPRMKPFLLPALLAASVVLAHAATPAETAAALLEAKNYPAAREAFTQLAAAEPQNAAACFSLGVIAQRLGETDEAVRQFERASALAPTRIDYLLQLADAYGNAAEKASLLSKLGWAKKCQTTLEQAVRIDPNSIPARNALITYYRVAPSFAGGGLSKAFEQAEEIKKRDPLAGAAVLGQLYLADKKIDQAFALYEEALKTAPDHYALLYGIGRAAAQTGQHLERGEAALRRCLELKPAADEPGPAPVQWRLGNIAEKRGDPAAARAAYEAAVKLDPNFKPAADSLAKLK